LRTFSQHSIKDAPRWSVCLALLLRDGEDLAFCRRVAERANDVLGGVRGLVLAGKADTKHRLHAELPQPLRRKVLCVVNLACSATAESLRQAASRASDAVDAEQRSEAEQAVRSFLESTAMPDSPAGITCCYGETQTAVALALGVIDVLLVATDWTSQTRTKDDWRALAEAHGTKIVEVKDRTQDGVQFCKAFQVGGCLRWPLGPELLEEPRVQEASNVAVVESGQGVVAEVATDPAQLCGEEPVTVPLACAAELPEATSSMIPCSENSGSHGLFEWLPSDLMTALGDEAAAEALLVCLEVILTDESTDCSEALDQVAAMLIGEGVPQTIIEEMIWRAQ